MTKANRYLVTIKLAKNPEHDPRNKKYGPCPANPQKLCSDSTGEHHTYLEHAASINEAMDQAKMKHGHVTRVESLDTY